jgi:hypothetical protein
MHVPALVHKVRHKISDNSPTILSSVAIAGVVTTAYLTGKASIAAHQHLQRHEGVHGKPDNPKDLWVSRVKVVWKHYIPAAASGAVTVGSIVGSRHVSHKRGAAVQAAFVLSERAFHEYRDAVIEEIGENKDRAIRDSIAKRKVNDNPPPVTIISGPGNVLCCELFTGRYFTSDMEELRRSRNDLNERLLKMDRVSMDDWYDMIGLQPTQTSSDLGWWSDRQMELIFTTVLTPDGRPCLAFEYNYFKPIYEGIFK